MKRYEPAGGVVSLDWKEGQPLRHEGSVVILAEIWDLRFSTYRSKAVHVEAIILPCRWSDTHEQYVSMFSGQVIEGKWIRWAPLYNKSTEVSLTLSDWP
jgi:hypothetical protein